MSFTKLLWAVFHKSLVLLQHSQSKLPSARLHLAVHTAAAVAVITSSRSYVVLGIINFKFSFCRTKLWQGPETTVTLSSYLQGHPNNETHVPLEMVPAQDKAFN